jgi:hypothetical protein
LKRGMLLSSIIAGTEINHGKGGFGNHSSVLVPLRSSMRASGPNQALERTAARWAFVMIMRYHHCGIPTKNDFEGSDIFAEVQDARK